MWHAIIRCSDGCTVLHYAATSENVQLTKLLLSAGIDVNLRDNDGQSALDLADHSEIQQLLNQKWNPFKYSTVLEFDLVAQNDPRRST